MKFNIEGLKDISRIVKELANGLRRLTFSENFQSFEITLTIASGSTSIVRNQLTSEPTKYIIVSSDSDGVISKGSTWDSNYISFKNNGSIQAEVTIIVLK